MVSVVISLRRSFDSIIRCHEYFGGVELDRFNWGSMWQLTSPWYETQRSKSMKNADKAILTLNPIISTVDGTDHRSCRFKVALND